MPARIGSAPSPRLECEYAAAALVDPDSVALESPRLPLDARCLRALIDDPGPRNSGTYRTKRLPIIAALARDSIDRRWPGRRTSAFDREPSGAAARYPYAVLLIAPRAALNARCLRTLLDEPRARDAAPRGTEL